MAEVGLEPPPYKSLNESHNEKSGDANPPNPGQLHLEQTGQHNQGSSPPPLYSANQLPQIVFVQNVSTASKVLSNYQGKLSVAFGVTNIVLTTVAIVLNGIGFAMQFGRIYDYVGNVFFILFPAVWCGLFIYLASAFSIASGKHKTRCLIVAHLVLAIIASLFAFVFICISAGSVAIEADYWPGSLHSDSDKISYAISVMWLVISVPMFITVIWCATLCCKVICCGLGNLDDGHKVTMTINNDRGAGGGPTVIISPRQ